MGPLTEWAPNLEWALGLNAGLLEAGCERLMVKARAPFEAGVTLEFTGHAVTPPVRVLCY